MKKLLIMCGTGIATSTIAVQKIKSWLLQNKLENKVMVFQSKISVELSRIDEYDIVVSTTIVPDHIKNKVIDGLPFLSGVGIDSVFEKIKAELETD